MSRRRRFWEAFKTIAIILSFIVNIVLIIIVVALVSQLGAIKATLNGIVGQLDSGFVSLGSAVVRDTIHIDQQVPVQFDLAVDQSGTATILQPVPLSMPATFSLGPFGTIYGTVSLSLHPGTMLPVQINMTVPVSNAIPVVFDQPVAIPLGERGLGPVIAEFRGVTVPLLETIQTLPDSVP